MAGAVALDYFVATLLAMTMGLFVESDSYARISVPIPP
jgi:hypothetical protein